MPEFNYPTMTSVEQVEEVVSSAIESAKTMKLRVQYAAIGCMILAGKQGVDEDGVPYAKRAIDIANYLVEQLGNGIRGDGLVKFMVYKCGFEVNEAAKKDGFIKVKSEEWIRANLEDAKSTAWESYAPSRPFQGFDMMEAFSKFIKDCDNAIKTAEADEEKAAKIEVDRDMVAVFHALKNGTPVKAEHALAVVEKLVPRDEIVTHEEHHKKSEDDLSEELGKQPMALEDAA